MRVVLGECQVSECAKPPIGYGCAYYDIERKCQVFYPLGIHWIVMVSRWLMFFYWRVAWWRPKSQRAFESRLRRAVHNGYSRGWMAESIRGKEVAEQEYDRGFRDGFWYKNISAGASQTSETEAGK